jgi:uncharacterized membrane protein YesL
MQNIMGGFYRISEWIMRFSVTNILWLLFNLPVIFFLVNLLLSKQTFLSLFIVVPMVLLVPFLFFPATAALFSCARDWVMDQEGSTLIGRYLKYYKENYKKSTLGGLILTGLWVILLMDYFYVKDISTPLTFVFIAFGLILYVYTINFFSVNAHYEIRLSNLFKKAFLITVGSPILLLVVLGSGLALLYVSMSGPLFILLFFAGSLVAFLSFSAFYRSYLRLTVSDKR